MRQRQINYLRHPMSSRQALSILVDLWRGKKYPVMLVTRKGQSLETVKHIRVALSKERAVHRGKTTKIHFGFTVSEPFPYTVHGITGEAVIIHWRLTGRQHMRNISSELFRKDSFDAY